MKTLMKISISLCLMLLTCATSYAQSAELADKYWDAAQALKKQGKYLEAAQMFAKSAQAEMESPRPRLKDLGVELGNAGYYYPGLFMSYKKKSLQSLHNLLNLW